MKIAVLGTGVVGRTLASRLAGFYHDVVIGTRDVKRTLSRTEPDRMGRPPYAEWQQTHPGVALVPFPEAGDRAPARPRARARAFLHATDALEVANDI
jgi:hypothetical protein